MPKGGFKKTIYRYRVPIQATAVATVAYSSGVIVNLVTSQRDTGANIWILGAGGFLLVAVLTLTSALLDKMIRGHEKAREREHSIHRSGYQTLNREISTYIEYLRELANGTRGPEAMPVELMKSACSDLYHTFENEYGGTGVVDHVEFEVTFMTESLRDGRITIAAWANRDGRAPKSLAARATNPAIYDGTETAKLYSDQNRSARIIRSTVGQHYKELYPGQKGRIKSSIIYPVLDDQYTLLGTLVVHCDEEGFFLVSALKLWRELLEPYTKRLALARVLAQGLVTNQSAVPDF